MFRGRRSSASARTSVRRFAPALALALAVFAAGCGSVAVSVDQPVGTQVELYQKGKWFGAFGPDWWTGWDKVTAQTVEKDRPAELELDARDGWLDSTLTVFPRKYRVSFDLSQTAVYPNTPASVIEVRYAREAVPPEQQNIIRLWHEGRTLDVLTGLPIDVLADVLYNLGDKFKRLLDEVPAQAQQQAAAEFKSMLAAPQPPSPQRVESWLKSLLTAEQLAEVCRWVEEGVTLTQVRWVRLGGEPKQKDVPVFWRLLKDVVELFVRQPEVRSTSVNFLEDVIIRDLMVKTTETKLVNLASLQFYAEVHTYKTSYFSDRTVPSIDLVQDIGLVDVVRPTAEQEAELQRYGMTRSVRFDRPARAAAIGSGLPPVSLQPTQMTSIRSEIIGALLEGEMAYVVIWQNPRKSDPVRFLTTVVTTGPYGMARVWALRGNEELLETTGSFEKNEAPVAMLASWVVRVLDQRSLFIKLENPVAVFAFGTRRIAPWSGTPVRPVSQVAPMKDLEPAEKAAGK